MKKIIELIRTKDRDDKSLANPKKSSVKEIKMPSQNLPSSQPLELPRDLFWDDYSDIGYC
jgi:hypothetical protein